MEKLSTLPPGADTPSYTTASSYPSSNYRTSTHTHMFTRTLFIHLSPPSIDPPITHIDSYTQSSQMQYPPCIIIMHKPTGTIRTPSTKPLKHPSTHSSSIHYLATHIPIHVFIHIICLFTNLFIHPSFHPFTYPFTNIFSRPTIFTQISTL